MWEPQEGISLNDAFYEVSKKLTKSRWNEFASRVLKLDFEEIENIQENHRNDLAQQKVEMCVVWSQKVGHKASVELLYQALNHFLFPGECRCPDFTGPAAKPEKKSGKNIDYVTKSHKSQERDVKNRCKISGEQSETPLEDCCSSVKEDFEVKPCLKEFHASCLEQPDIYKYDEEKVKGSVIIINNNFDNKRKGSEVDVKNMERLWNELGFQVKTLKDLTAERMETELKAFAKYSALYNCVVTIIMSHGNCKNGEGIVCGNNYDGELTVKHIVSLFNNENSKQLIGKPKLFFMQCCRGLDYDDGVDATDALPISMDCTPSENGSHVVPDGKILVDVPVREETVADALGLPNEESHEKKMKVKKESKKLPTVSDVLVAYPAQYGNRAFRNTVTGSWFINAITNVFRNQAKDKHLLDLMTRVNHQISNKCSNCSGAYKAMSQIEHSLTKDLFFYPGI